MIIERICLEDFGIFRNQIIEGIHSGLVVIVGGNRAGKTTLMNALRYLGYGLPKRSVIPPPSGEHYKISADIRLHDGGKHNIQLTGHGAPRVSPLEGSKAATIAEIYGELDSYTYRQVFTISLEELRRIPEDASSREEAHLQAVLLGGGWSDALSLMQIRQEFAKKAHEIGGKKGSKNTFQFKPWSQTIHQGIELRDSANKQMDDFYELQEQLASYKDSLAKQEQSLELKQQELDLQELICTHYQTYQDITQLSNIIEAPENKGLLDTFPPDGLYKGSQLLEQLPKALQKHELLSARFEASAGTDIEALLEHGDTIDLYEKRLSGWRHEAKSLEEAIKEHKQAEAELTSELSLLNAGWDMELSQLETLQLDLINEEKLLALINDYAETHTLVKDRTREIEETKLALGQKEDQAKNLGSSKSHRFPGVFALTAIGLVAVLLTAALFGSTEALATGVAAGAGILAYVLYDLLGSKSTRKELLERQIDELRDKLLLLERQKSEFDEALLQIDGELKSMLQSLSLPANLPYTTVPDFLRRAKDLKRRYNNWLVKGKQIEEQIDSLNNLKAKISNLLGKIGLDLTGLAQASVTLNETDPAVLAYRDVESTNIAELFDLLNVACGHLALARELKESQLEKEKLEKEALELVEITTGDDLPAALDSFLDKGLRFDQLKEDQQRLEALKTGLRQALAPAKYLSLIHI